MKRELRWIGLLTAFGMFVVLAPDFFGWQIMHGTSGLAIKFFLGYCAIILVAQVFAALVALRSLAMDAVKPKAISQRMLFKTEQPASAPEE